MRCITTIGLLALLAAPTHAEHAVPGLRAGIAAAFGNFDGADVPDETLGSGFIDDNTVGFKAHAQYQFNDWFALEGAYHTTSDFEEQEPNELPAEELSLSFTGFSFQAVGYLPWRSEDVQGYVKVGYFDFDDELSTATATTSTSAERGLAAGGGMVIEISERIGVRGDFDWFDMDVGDLWSINLGFEYYFGGTSDEKED
jgi:hypothetical protein